MDVGSKPYVYLDKLGMQNVKIIFGKTNAKPNCMHKLNIGANMNWCCASLLWFSSHFFQSSDTLPPHDKPFVEAHILNYFVGIPVLKNMFD